MEVSVKNKPLLEQSLLLKTDNKLISKAISSHRKVFTELHQNTEVNVHGKSTSLQMELLLGVVFLTLMLIKNNNNQKKPIRIFIN